MNNNKKNNPQLYDYEKRKRFIIGNPCSCRAKNIKIY